MKQEIRRSAIAILLFGILLLLPNDVYATPGFLKKDSIKTCPNGNTYGYHSQDNHWHAATRSGSDDRWRASGDPLPGDPCPSSGASGNNNSSSSTSSSSPSGSSSANNSGSSSSSNNSSSPSSPSSSGKPSNSSSSSGSNNTSSNGASSSLNSPNNSSIAEQGTESKEETKSGDTSIKTLKINGHEVPLTSSPLYYALEDESLDSIDIELNDSKATYSISDYNPDFTDEKSAQEIAITVTAEDGTVKIYTLDVVKKIPSVGLNVWVKEDSNQIKLQDSSKEYTLDDVPFWQNKQCFVYELANNTANVEITSNGNVVTDCATLNVGSNHIVFKITNKYGDEDE